MLTQYHLQITREALETHFSPRALDVILKANIGQDDVRGQIGHDEFHFDNNAFDRASAYLEAQRVLVADHLARGEVLPAWQAFGRLTHVAQDFYAHSNYLRLWLDRFAGGPVPTPDRVDPVDSALLASPELRSGRIYFPWEFLSFVPGLKWLVIPLLPRDAHAHMNIDHPGRPLFDYAYAAAVMRTRLESDRTLAALPEAQGPLFFDL
jgi:hypothetical protein